jgi:hypothetical protein
VGLASQRLSQRRVRPRVRSARRRRGLQRQPEHAARLFGATEAVREALGAPVPPSERADYERHVAAVRAALDAAAWAAGRAMALEDAIVLALDEPREG